jgi:hypothetical protein
MMKQWLSLFMTAALIAGGGFVRLEAQAQTSTTSTQGKAKVQTGHNYSTTETRTNKSDWDKRNDNKKQPGWAKKTENTLDKTGKALNQGVQKAGKATAKGARQVGHTIQKPFKSNDPQNPRQAKQ